VTIEIGILGDTTTEIISYLNLAMANTFVYLLIITFGFSLLTLLIWYVYRKLAQRDIIKLDLKKYDVQKWAMVKKSFALISYIIKYILVFPILLFIMYAIVSMSLFILSGSTLTITSILFFSLIIISVVRTLAYIKEDAAREISKMLPFALILTLFTSGGYLEGTMAIPDLGELVNALMGVQENFIFIIGIELVLRILYTTLSNLLKPFRKKKGKQRIIIEQGDINENN